MGTSSFKIGQLIGQYKVLDAKEPNAIDQDRNAEAIGVGASAEVCLVEQTLTAGVTINRALKFYSPNSKVLARRNEAGLSAGKESFLAEIRAISSFNHQNLVKVIDAGVHDKQPYFVMEFVDGASLESLLNREKTDFENWKSKAQADPFLVLRMARQLCWPTSHLHSFHFYHFDIAPKNVFVRAVSNKPHLILGDLGVGQSVPDVTDPDLAKMPDIFIGGTREYTPTVLHPYLNFREKKLVPASFLAKYATYWDVFAIATVLEEMIEKWELKDHPDLIATKILCNRAKNYDEHFDALRFTNELERLLPAQVLTAGVQELSSDAFGKRTYVAIPLYSVPISERVDKIIRHPAFVRLQRVPQFLLGRTVFPGGVHTRYEHALGAYALGQRYLLKLLSNPQFRADFSKKELEEALICILLSKLVSFVFDFAFFELFSTNEPTQDVDARKDRMNLFLSMKSFRGQETLRDVVESAFPDVEMDMVISILAGAPPSTSHQARLIAGIVRSSIDVRVLDYLGRDSHHTGIPPGSGIDIDHIVESLTWDQSTGHIGISRTGVFSVEHLLCARYWMYNRVYWNTINRSLASMVRYTLYAMMAAGDLGTNHFIKEIMNFDEPSALEWLHEEWDATAGDKYKHASLLDLLRLPRPRPYRLLLELSGKTWSETKINVARCMSLEQLEEKRVQFLENCSLSSKLSVSSILFDIPQDKTLKLGEDIFVETTKGKREKLTDVSEIAKILPKAFLETAFKFRVFYHPESSLTEPERAILRHEVEEFLNHHMVAQ